MTRRRSALALLAAGSACLVSAALPAVHAVAADADPGSGLGSFNLAASAPAVQARFQEPTYCYGTAAATNGCELVLPEAVSTLRNGPIGTGLASVAWPGTLASSAGSLLITASNGQVPDSATALNDPVKAEARTSTGPDTVTYDQVPGTTMKAVAKDDRISAEASIDQAQATPFGSFGKTSGTSSTVLTGPSTAVATARSTVQDITLAGVVHLGSVTSEATATTDGKQATVHGTTLVTGATIANVPVTIDEHGVSVAGTSLPVSTATDTVNTALRNLGMTIALAQPNGKPDGASVTYNAGGVVLMWTPQPGYTATVVLGGANVSVVASPAFSFTMPAFAPPPMSGPVSAPVTGGTSSLPSLGSPGSAPAPQLPGPVTAGAPNPVMAPVLAAAHAKLPGGLPVAYVLLGVVGCGLIAAGLRRLPDQVLAASAAACPLEETA
ncbi:MAG: hypothetical protein WCD35_12195 [Mycobacteriales bacterium]